jgi:hypothetical protein
MSAPTTRANRQESVLGHVRPADFRHRAACRDIDPELFFPAAEDGPEHDAQVRAAKAVCASCPVRSQCLAWALDALPYGIAGEMTEQERRTERARRRSCDRRRAARRPVRGTTREVAAAGRAAMACAGRAPREVAREFGVSERTAARWAAQVRVQAPAMSRAGGSAAAGQHGKDER